MLDKLSKNLRFFLSLVLIVFSTALLADEDVADYEDTDFGEFLYNESSTETRIEVADLLDTQRPSSMVFLQAISMGLGIDEVLDAAIKLDSDRRSDFTASAISLLPVVSGSKSYDYGRYDHDSLEQRYDEGPFENKPEDQQPYEVAEVVERFFENRDVLVPYPDWYAGQSHFTAAAHELMSLIDGNLGIEWYRSKSSKPISPERPIFVSLYESTKTILVDGEDRIEQAYNADPNAEIPVVFVFNKLVERSIDTLGYDKTVKGIQKAYLENALMITPTPEWYHGEYSIMADIQELDEIFELPTEAEFEPEEWQLILDEAKQHKVEDESFLIVVLPAGGLDNEQQARRNNVAHKLLYASNESITDSLKEAFKLGLIINRPERLAALKHLGVTKVPVAFYYIDRARVKPYKLGLRGLRIIGGYIPGSPPPVTPPPCASPPCR